MLGLLGLRILEACGANTADLGEEPFPSWRRHDRLVALLLGQMDKEFPIVLTLAVIARL